MRARALLCAAVVALGACGGGERQDADEPAGEFRLDVTRASFPAEQQLAQATVLALEVRNADDRRVPTVAVTIETEPSRRGGAAPVAFGQDVDDPALAASARPVWIVDEPPAGGVTAYTNTWALGPLGPGERKRFEWRVTAVKPGSYTLAYRVSPGVDGKARLAEGSADASGAFDVTIDDAPVDARIDDAGEVVKE